MGSTVGMKAGKKQPATSQQRSFEQALMVLEDICLDIREGEFTHGKGDIDRLYWQQKLKNLAVPLSLALAEYKGPRVFHHHYKHENGNGAMTPVMESARDNLMRTCTKALRICEEMNGVKGSKLLEEKRLLERALRLVAISAEANEPA